MEAFSTMFGDSDQKIIVVTKILSLQQRTQSVVMFVSNFQQYACDLKWNDKALINQFCYDSINNVKRFSYLQYQELIHSKALLFKP